MDKLVPLSYPCIIVILKKLHILVPFGCNAIAFLMVDQVFMIVFILMMIRHKNSHKNELYCRATCPEKYTSKTV